MPSKRKLTRQDVVEAVASVLVVLLLILLVVLFDVPGGTWIAAALFIGGGYFNRWRASRR